jgi:hypothetical protein
VTIAEYARSVFADAYALHGPVPTPESARALCDQAVAMATENPTDLSVLTMVAEIAKYEGLLATLAERREKLSKRWKRKAAPIIAGFAGFDASTYATSASAHLGSLGLGADKKPDDDMDDDAKDPTYLERQRAAKTIAVVALRAFLKDHPELESDWTELVTVAEAEAMAEGIVEGSALVEPQQVVLDLDQLYTDTLVNLRTLDTLGENAPAWITTQLEGLAGDMGKAIADGIARNFGPEDLAKSVGEVIGKGEGVQLYIDESIHYAMQAASISQMAALGVDQLDFVTQPDACAICAPLDSSIVGPYSVGDCPVPGIHIHCRCTVAPAGTVS